MDRINTIIGTVDPGTTLIYVKPAPDPIDIMISVIER